MTQVKRQHYVPRSYLTRFTSNGDSLCVFDKIRQKTFRTNITNVACEKYFYDIPEDSAIQVRIDPQAVEKLLAAIEGGFSFAVESLLKAVSKKKRRVIKRNQKQAMAYFLTIQLLRTRDHRNLITESLEKMGEALLLKTSDYSPDDFRVVADEEWVTLFQSQFMFSPQARKTFMRALCQHIWFVGVNDAEQPFYTSDNPVVRKGHYRDSFRSFSGIASPGIEIAFPLSPRCILVLCGRTAFRHYRRFDCKTMSLNSDNVTYYNSLQVFQSHRQIYCSSEKLDLAERICSEHPEICVPNRNRLQVN
jgi:hypothetical protein